MKNGSEPPLDDYQKLVFGRLRHFGKVVVEAAPGTGKTFTGISLAVNAAREQWISNERPSLFLTFSKNARVQIENELRHYEGQGWLTQGEKAAIRISNYHAFFFELLRKRGGIWGLKKDFRPCTLTYRKERIKEIFKKSKLNYADYKESLCSALCWNESEISLPREIVPVYKELAIADIKNQQPHYNEFAPLVYYLLESSTELRKWLMIKYPLLILDEFQDSDCCQWKILKVWNPLKAAIFYDSYQMIYGWRKANPGRIQEVIDWWNIPAESQIELKTLHRAGSQRTLANFIVDLRADKLMGSHVFIGNKRWLTLISCSNRTWREVKPQEQARDRIRWGQMIVSGETTGIICKANDMVFYLHQQLRKKPSSRSGPYFACKRVESESTDERLRDYLHQLKI